MYFKITFIHEVEFSASLLQSSVSHDTSEIILICCLKCLETYIINVFSVTFGHFNATLQRKKYLFLSK